MANNSTNRKINIWINGKQVENSYKGISNSMRKARNELANMTIGSKAYLEQTKKLKQLQKLMDDHRTKQGLIANGWTKVRNEFKSATMSFFAGNMITTAVEKMGSAISGLITGAASLSDELADIQKTTGLSAAKVDELNSSLSKIDTRTSTSELRNLAAIAGKLGKNSKEEVLEFVGAADKLVVALGEDLGGLDAIKQLGKLNELFNIEEVYGTAVAFEKTGSAINSLGAASVASEEYLVAFTQRFGGLAENANISIQDVLGLGATMDILGKKQEVASSSMAKFLIALGDKEGISHFAKLAGMNVKEYSKLLETDANEAMLKVLEGAKSSGKGITGLSKTLQNLGVDGVQAAQVLPALAGNIDLLREQQALANDEFEKGTSLSDEFAIKNENLAAKLAKLKKAWVKLWMNSDVKNAISDLVDSLTDIVAWVKENSYTIKLFAKAIGVVIIAITSYNMALKANAAWTNLMIIKNNLLKKAQLMAALVQAKLTGNTKRAAAAQRMLNIAMKANPWGLAVAVIVAAVAALVIFKDTLLGVNSLEKARNEILKETNKRMGEESVKLDILKNRINKANVSNEERKALIKEINTNYGDYLPNLLDENSSLNDIAKAYDLINNGIRKKIELQVKEEKAKEIYKEIAEIQDDLANNSLYNIKKGIFYNAIGHRMKLKELKELTKTYNTLTSSLTEVAIKEAEVNKNSKVQKKTKKTTNSGSGTKKTEIDLLAEWKQKYEQLRKTITDLRRSLNLADLSEEDKQRAQLSQKYDDQLSVVTKSIEHFVELKQKKGSLNAEEYALLENFYNQRNQLVKLKEDELFKLEKEFADKKVKAKEKLQKQIDELLLDESQKEVYAITKKYQTLIDKATEYGIDTTELYAKMSEEIKALNKEVVADADILGMTDEDWDKFNKHFNAAMEIAGQFSSMMNAFYQIQRNNDAVELASFEENTSKKKEALDYQLKANYISQKNYDSKIAALDKKMDDKKKQLSIDEANRTKKQQIFESLINLASGAVKIWSHWGWNPPVAIGLTTLLGITAGAELAAINSTPIPKMGKGARVNKPTIAEIGEAGPEIVLSSSIVTDKNLGPIADDLARIQEGKQPNLLGKPQTPNFTGMTKAITNQSTSVVTNNTVINQIDAEGMTIMQNEISNMRNDISTMTKSVVDLKYLRAIITDDDLTEHEEDKELRVKYSEF